MKKYLFTCLLYLFYVGTTLLLSSFLVHAQDEPRKIRGMARELYQEGVFYGKQGKYIQAESALEKAIELYPAYADAYNALGVIYYRQKQNQKAIEQYLLAIETQPTHVKARTNLAIIYHEQHQDQKARHQLKKALEIQPDYSPARKLMGSVKRKTAELAAKERERQEKASQKPTPPPAQKKISLKKPTPRQSPFAAATKLFREGKLDAGIQAYQKELTRKPHSAEGYTLLGMAYREQFRITRDARWFQQGFQALTTALEYDKRYIPALIGLGEFSFEQGYFSTAAIYLRDALTYQPDHPANDQIEIILRYIQ